MVAIVALVAGIVGWLLLMPWVPAIAATTLKRFHLQTNSFVAWAVQFPVPAMYNFANRYEVSPTPPAELGLTKAADLADHSQTEPSQTDPSQTKPGTGTTTNDHAREKPSSKQRMLNHFPVRILTFADGRFYHLRHHKDRWLTVESSYRGQTLRSYFHAEPVEDHGGFVLERLESSLEER